MNLVTKTKTVKATKTLKTNAMVEGEIRRGIFYEADLLSYDDIDKCHY